jgi:hypothetical protein
LGAGGDNQPNDRIEIGQHISGGNTQRAKAALGQIGIAGRVACRAVAAIMCFAIYLNREAHRQAGEVETPCADRVLLAELEPAWTRAKCTPQDHLGQVAAAALAAC